MTTMMQFDTGHPVEDLTPTAVLEVGHIVTDVLGDAWVVLDVGTTTDDDAWLQLRDANMEIINMVVPAADVDTRTWHVIGSPWNDQFND